MIYFICHLTQDDFKIPWAFLVVSGPGLSSYPTCSNSFHYLAYRRVSPYPPQPCRNLPRPFLLPSLSSRLLGQQLHPPDPLDCFAFFA